MASPDSASRPTYVYLLALTALLLFGANFASYMSTSSCDGRSIVVEHQHPRMHARLLAPMPPQPPMPPLPEVRIELERARAEVHKARKAAEIAVSRAPSATVVYVR